MALVVVVVISNPEVWMLLSAKPDWWPDCLHNTITMKNHCPKLNVYLFLWT